MNPEIQNLIRGAVAKEIPIDAYYSRMGALGVTMSEAQTMLSQAVGMTEPGLDPALDSDRSQPINPSAYDYAPAQTATSPRNEYSPTASILEKMRNSPAAQAVDFAKSRLNIPSGDGGMGNGPGSSPSSGPSNFARMTPASAGTQAGNLIASRLGGSSTPQQPVPPPLMEDRADRAMASDAPASLMEDRLTRALPSDAPSTVQQAINVAKTRQAAMASSPQVAAQSASEPSALASLIRGRFGEAGRGSPFDDRLTAYQEARDRMGEGRAAGGEVGGKQANPRDAALHKALEIIHYMLTR